MVSVCSQRGKKTEKQGFSHKSHTCENQDVFKDFLVEPETVLVEPGPPPETFCISRLPKLDFM